MTWTVFGPARCVECGAVWRVVQVTLSEGGCVRCGGDLEEVDPGDAPIHRRVLEGRLLSYSREDPHRIRPPRTTA